MFYDTSVKKVVAITQCFQCGSWVCIEKVLDRLSDLGYKVTVVGLGKTQECNSKFVYYTIPYLAFNKYGDITCKSPVLSLLWNLPLILGGLLLIAIQGPKAIVYNGLATSLVMAPLARLRGCKNIIMYHSFINPAETFTTKVLRFLGTFTQLTVVNSKGSKENIACVIDSNKIIINEHYADDFFFAEGTSTGGNAGTEHNGTLTILYVGRIDEDKLCLPLIEAAEKMGDDSRFRFIFAGAGSGQAKVKTLAERWENVTYLGYISNRAELKKLYKKADVLWSFADVTYLGLPAIEALACGTPIIVPKYAAIMGNRKPIELGLVPESVGWVIDTNSEDEIINLLIRLQQNGISRDMQERCVGYAKEKYSSANIQKTVEEIHGILVD